MNLKINKKAFSLTELLIVLVIVAILFAALLPIMTKRKAGATTANEPVWSFVSNDDQKDAFYDGSSYGLTSTAYMGVKPEDLTGNVKPYSKMVVKAKNKQNLIQFRYGSGNGSLTGLFAMDNKYNTMLTTRLSGSESNNYNNIIGSSSNNTAFGVGSFKTVTGAAQTTAFGSGTLSNANNQVTESLILGSNSALYGVPNYSVFVGSNAGRMDSTTSSNIGIGAQVLALEDSTGTQNVLVGYYVGSAGFLASDGNSPQYNTVVGANEYFGQKGPRNNTIIGYGTFRGGNNRAANLTVLGYGACDSILDDGSVAGSVNTGSRTCIGYESAMGSGTSPTSYHKDNYDHIFLGGRVASPLSGRAPLEIHNIENKPSLSALPKMGPTVVLNSNLVVRGNVYFPRVSDGELVVHAQQGIPNVSDASEQNKDWCSKGCHLRRKHRKWRDKDGCKILADIFKFLFNWIVTGIFSALVGAFTDWWTPGNWIVSSFAPSSNNRKRAIDNVSMATMSFSNRSDTKCNASNKCPQLKTSDIRLKDNIAENDDSIEKLMLVMPYNFTYKDDKDKTPRVGVMAQDLQKYSPNSVSEDKYGYLSIRWDELFYVTINSIKDLDKQTQHIAEILNIVESDTKSVASEQKDLEKRIADINKRIDKLDK